MLSIRIFTKKAVERERLDMETAKLIAEEREKKLKREERRQWAIESAICVCEGCSVDEVLRVAKRIYAEAFGEEWSE